MILKYKVPKEYRKRFDNQKVIYCEIKKQLELKSSDKKIYLVNMINYKNMSNMFGSEELYKLNIFDKIKVKFEGWGK